MLNFICALFAVFAITGFSTNGPAETKTSTNGQTANSSDAKAKPRRRISYVGEAPLFNPSQETMDKMNDPEEPFNGYQLRHSIGLEGGLPVGGSGSPSTSILSSPAVSYSVWNSPTTGWEFFFGTSKTADSQRADEAYATTYTSGTLSKKVTTTTYSGTANPRTFILGLAYKYRIYQVKHFGLSADFLASFIPKRSTEYYDSGSKKVTVNNPISAPDTYTIDDTVSTTQTSYANTFGIGPRFNIEYNFPYLPNLLIGMSTGVFVNFGGSKTNVVTTNNQSTTYTGGVAGTPTYSSGHGNTTTTTTDYGANGTTYGIGGTGLTGSGGIIPISLVGTFRLRYAF